MGPKIAILALHPPSQNHPKNTQNKKLFYQKKPLNFIPGPPKSPFYQFYCYQKYPPNLPFYWVLDRPKCFDRTLFKFPALQKKRPRQLTKVEIRVENLKSA